MRSAIPTWYFVVVVVQLEGHFLMVHERKEAQDWYLPAGRVEPGESLVQAAERETFEETGVEVTVTGILRLEHTPRADGSARMRVIFTAKPRGDFTPKSEADEHSLEAAWVTPRDPRYAALARRRRQRNRRLRRVRWTGLSARSDHLGRRAFTSGLTERVFTQRANRKVKM